MSTKTLTDGSLSDSDVRAAQRQAASMMLRSPPVSMMLRSPPVRYSLEQSAPPRLSSEALQQVLGALAPVIEQAIREAVSERNRQAAMAKRAAAKVRPATYSAHKNTKRATDRELSALAADIAAATVAQKRHEGRGAHFADEQHKILGELRQDPRGARARYAKYIAQEPRKLKQDSPPADLMTQVYEAARLKLPASVAVSRYSRTGHYATAFESALRGVNEKASAAAMKKCQARVPGTFSEHFDDALAELRSSHLGK